MGDLATTSATTAPLHVAKANTDVQAIFGDNNSTIDDPSIRIIGRDSANSATRYMFAGLDADANYGFIGYNHGSGSFTNALNFDTSGNVSIGISSVQTQHALTGNMLEIHEPYFGSGVGGTLVLSSDNTAMVDMVAEL